MWNQVVPPADTAAPSEDLVAAGDQSPEDPISIEESRGMICRPLLFLRHDVGL